MLEKAKNLVGCEHNKFLNEPQNSYSQQWQSNGQSGVSIAKGINKLPKIK
jgi:hypothetical protein